jgi:hypothetical protein
MKLVVFALLRFYAAPKCLPVQDRSVVLHRARTSDLSPIPSPNGTSDPNSRHHPDFALPTPTNQIFLSSAPRVSQISVKNCFIRGSVVRYVQIPKNEVDTDLLQDAARREHEKA